MTEPKALSKGSLLVGPGQAVRYWWYGDHGPPMILCNSLLGGVSAWFPFVTHFEATHRLLLWEYQGHGLSSGLPAGGEVSVSSFAKDALRLLAGTGTERAIFVGLGFGVQVVLEAYRISPPRVLSLIGMAGAEEGQFSAVVPLPLASLVSRSLQRLVLPLGVPVWRVVRAAWAAGLPLRRKGGQGVNPGGQRGEARSAQGWAERMARTDPHVGLRILTSILFYRPGRLLPEVTIPFLILGGAEDRLVSPRRVADLAGKIPDSRLVLLPGCSHSLMTLAPARVNRVVAEFLAEKGLS